MIGKEYVNKLNGMKISLDTLHRRIADISADILDQMIQEMKSSTLPIFSIQLDESTNVENGSQLLVYASALVNDIKFVEKNYDHTENYKIVPHGKKHDNSDSQKNTEKI
ncbi:hypothetical protein RF11_16025 [Thelohanellus kitauei]|uniref:Zinc finger BED domain-containing protein 5 n=1 Tax=Thelohanellus kitauei TaxID=669202 RepID=A0A0C2JBJ7_THEKT|nr:hypothetical protein RF11_16025 [Thelohanellus kitauei]